jgi:enoyl-CoA hydratase/carnithine racemase
MIRTAQQGAVRRITLAAPLQRNVLTGSMAREFLTALTDAEADASTGAILVDAEGQIFCGGMDFQDPPEGGIFTFGDRATKPVIAAIQGVAQSAGVALLANFHIVLAAQGSSFGLTDLREGRCDARVNSAVARVLGERRTRELALSGRIFTTPEALQWGLVHASTPVFELEDRALATATGIANANRAAVQEILKRK